MSWFEFLADLVLLLHFSIVAFVVLSLPLIFIGGWVRWDWVRNPVYRYGHFGLMAFIAGQSALGLTCPLTIWEKYLRQAAGEQTYQGDFIEHWVAAIVFYRLPPSYFVVAYFTFLFLVILTWVGVRPLPWRRRR